MSDYVEDIKKYTNDVNETAVENIVKYCGIALRSKDASLVSASDPKELKTVADGFATKKLELSADDANTGIEKVCEAMKGVRQKHRVTFYYLLAQHTNTMGKLT